MDIRSILKKCMLDFLIIQAGITLTIGIIICIHPPSYRVTYEMFFMPFVYAFFCVIPSLILYPVKEPGVRQMLVRKVIHFVLVELIVIVISAKTGILDDTFMCVAIPLSATAIYLIVNVLTYFFYKTEADTMIKKIQHIRAKEKS